MTKGRELPEGENDSRHDETLNELDKQLFTMKQRIAEALRSSTDERVPAQDEVKPQEVEHHDEFHKSVSERGSTSQH